MSHGPARAGGAALAAALLACATAPPPAPVPPLAQPIERVPHARGELAAHTPVEDTVRMAQAPDLASLAPTDPTARETLELATRFALEAGGFAILGWPVAVGGFALIYPPLITALNASERAQIARIQRDLAEVEFTPRAQEALDRLVVARLGATPNGVGSTKVELIVVGYGFAPGPEGACFFLDARLRVAPPGADAREEPIVLGAFWRSDDAPPPHCASRDELEADAGALTRHVTEDSAEILAAIAASRLAERP